MTCPNKILIFIKNNHMAKDTTKINIRLSPEIISKIEEGNYNRNKLPIFILGAYMRIVI